MSIGVHVVTVAAKSNEIVGAGVTAIFDPFNVVQFKG